MGATDFNDHIRLLRAGEAPSERLFDCPYCGGTALIDAGEIARARRPGISWARVQCYDCGAAERFDGFEPWPGIEALTGPFHFPESETSELIRRVLAAGSKIEAIRLYREQYDADLSTALIAVDAMSDETADLNGQP